MLIPRGTLIAATLATALFAACEPDVSDSAGRSYEVPAAGTGSTSGGVLTPGAGGGAVVTPAEGGATDASDEGASGAGGGT